MEGVSPLSHNQGPTPKSVIIRSNQKKEKIDEGDKAV